MGHLLFSSGFPASNTATFNSGAFFTSSYAAKIPPGPAPIMITSYLLILPDPPMNIFPQFI